MSLHSLMFGWEYPPFHSGGLGVACQGLVKGMLRNGMRVTLVLPTNTQDEHEQLTTRSSAEHLPEFKYVKSMLQPYEGMHEYEKRLHMTTPAEAMDNLYGPNLGEAVEHFARMSVDITKNVQADVVHCHDWMTFDAGARAAQFHRKPLVAHIHATELDRTDFKPDQWIADKERRGLLNADKIIAVSQYTKNMLVNHYGIPADKIAVVHNGHTAPVIEQKNDILLSEKHAKIPLVLFLGRLTTQKTHGSFWMLPEKSQT